PDAALRQKDRADAENVFVRGYIHGPGSVRVREKSMPIYVETITPGNRLSLLITLFIMAAGVYLFTASDRAILDDGDALYSHVAQNMAASGDWVTPYANGVRFLDKPPMLYWLTAASFRVFGVNEFAVRFPAACAVAAITLLLFFLGRKAAGPFAGFVAGSAFAFCAGTFLFTLMAFPDIYFVFFLTLAVAAFYAWYRDDQNTVFPALLFYAATAGAVLSKGLIGLAFPAATAFLFLLWSRNLSRLRHFHLVKGTLLFLLLAAPWHVLAAVRNPGFLWYYFVNEQFLRFLGKRQPMDYESISLPIFWALALTWLFPWSVFLPALRHVWRGSGEWNSAGRDAMRICFCWAFTVFVFFSVSSRIEHYSMPIFPPLAILIGMAFSPDGFVVNRAKKATARGFAFLGILGGAAALTLIAGGLWLMFGAYEDMGQSQASARLHAYKYYFAPLFEMPPEIISRLITPLTGTLAALALGFTGAWLLARRERLLSAVLAMNLAMVGFCLFTWQSVGICEGFISSRQFGQKLNEIYRPGDAAVVLGDFETANSINFYAPIPLYIYNGSAALLTEGMSYPDAPQMLLTPEFFSGMWEGNSRVFLLAPEDRLPELKLQSAWPVLSSFGRILVCNQVFHP
ncbi:MAG: glycosyltransferase family 39 protein, partial [Acidobacteria bacterium]|nr:glycosyltransferase family 39 protein [Acidobacteriota bacterium]